VRRFFSELKRRKVYQVGVVYLIVVVGGLELADALVPSTRLPDWTDEFLLVIAIVGFAVVLVFAWVFDLGPGGVQRTPDADSSAVAESEPSDAPADVPAPASEPESESPSARPDLDPKTVAVLPFANLSDAADAAPFAAGLHDDLLTELSRASALTVISRTSVQGYRETTKSMTEIGRELGAGTIIEGGVQRAGDRVRLNIQLIDARSDAHLWAERYDRELSAENIFDLQTELAGQIMEQLRTNLTGVESSHEATPPTGDLEAYRQYSIGRAFFVERSEEALQSATRAFERAVGRDPEYALAWAGLSMALTMTHEYGHGDSDDTLQRAESAAQRALELDPELAEAHSAHGLLFSARRSALEALAAQTRAAALRPGYAGAHQWRSWASLLAGDARTAREAGTRAVQLDPLDPEARGDLACAHLGCGDDEAALREARTTLETHPEYDWPRWVEGLALLHLGRDDEAMETMKRLSEPWAVEWPETMRALGMIRAGDEAGARRALEDVMGSGGPFHAGLLRIALGEVSEGIDVLREGLPLGWDQALYLRYFRGWPIADARDQSAWPTLVAELNRAWGAVPDTP
jgi:TolB-like protein/Flp pilus assembly protein TadD